IQDMNFQTDTTSGKEGLELLANIREINLTLPVILFTAWGNIDLAVLGMRQGASNFFTKPWDNNRLIELISDTLNLDKHSSGKMSRTDLEEIYNFSSIIGNSKQLLEQLETAGKVANTRAPILIRGENGTGKDILAHAIHLNSDRKDQPFVKVNVGGISSSLFDSEMFGHVKGAFTDAKTDRQGRFEQADHGTIFLDEIGELSMDSQVKLLRVLQEGQFERLGSGQTIQIDVRIVAATNVDLEAAIKAGGFREDLFYRLNTIELHLPPLRERGKDKLELADHFLKHFAATYNKGSLQFSRQALDYLEQSPWKGNIRELRHAIERGVLVSSGQEIDFQQKSDSIDSQLPEVGSMSLDDMEKQMIIKTLKHTDYNISRTSELLGINRTSLYRRLEKYDIDV
ncbi:MAG: sigma-54-dependent Fis family transcriptional regulator, partial [Calditrichaeota bacterium]|nr:sigma-54-dependent Fis family transcriptional regulator [Calditrichota bacterium]